MLQIRILAPAIPDAPMGSDSDPVDRLTGLTIPDLAAGCANVPTTCLRPRSLLTNAGSGNCTLSLLCLDPGPSGAATWMVLEGHPISLRITSLGCQQCCEFRRGFPRCPEQRKSVILFRGFDSGAACQQHVRNFRMPKFFCQV